MPVEVMQINIGMKKLNTGGPRRNAGRKRKVKTTTLSYRVPLHLSEHLDILIKQTIQNATNHSGQKQEIIGGHLL